MSSNVDFLEAERKKIWERLTDLENKIESNATKDEREIWQIKRKCTEYKNNCFNSKEDAIASLESIHSHSENIKSTSKAIEMTFDKSSNNLNNTNQILNEIRTLKEDFEVSIEDANRKLVELEEIHEGRDTYRERASDFNEKYDALLEVFTKSEATLKNIIANKNEVDELKFEMFGYFEHDEEKEEDIKVAGLIDKLKASFNEAKKDLDEAKGNLNNLYESQNELYSKLKESSENSAQEVETYWERRLTSIQNTIEGLLPDALTAGLSSAFSKKKVDEEKIYLKHSKSFSKAIFGLILISLIPFGVSVSYILDGKTLNEAILNIPKLAVAILPLYVPALWVAYSANKKVNLSKRLIEEYAHKEVISKTYEGLSSQIETLDHENETHELRTKLLYNMLNVSAENPGKLISDYNTSDHPVIDALEKSAKFSSAISTLNQIPGMQKLSDFMKKKSQAKLDKQNQKTNDGFDSLPENEV